MLVLWLLFTNELETIGVIMILFLVCNLLMYVMEVKAFVKMMYIPSVS